MNKKSLVTGFVLAAMLTLGINSPIYSAAQAPVTVEGDTLEYDAASGVVKASGNVNFTQADTVMTSAAAEYNLNTKEAYLSGGVNARRQDTTLSAGEVRSYENTHLIATGDVLLTKGQDRLNGAKVDYYTDKQYAMVTGGARLVTADAVMTAASLEAFTAENRAVGYDNVHFVSEARNADATADRADYYGPQTGKSKVILTGNAHAVQDGNIFSGSLLTLYLDDKVADAQGRAKLIIQPQ